MAFTGKKAKIDLAKLNHNHLANGLFTVLAIITTHLDRWEEVILSGGVTIVTIYDIVVSVIEIEKEEK